ncbi:PAS domain S-box-containing protein/diguanylate cyclase (GGDEF) domain-containing protein [Halolactibacillus halophilus]|uniref:PAS domain S-box-containing protein/diguanylate cyclase (GGDEF) domain-containing protein n=1 Tax=Halolactibacillus halophilus TaxID=306540 RepID=A0A1I5SLV9_9BACI|nr:bifunctional diguanylate cyclase/phosphodiesterase [Halolactibacillus halophilus]GEM02612.1 hypothetical protein HHA03_21440 [Halolactibacillus halophilus]SFP71712.1 PAS domain S-box-containing protein/diguanylate cyclase (GGDEF) domain-containing protein [Halolactibacillus halophilus]
MSIQHYSALTTEEIVALYDLKDFAVLIFDETLTLTTVSHTNAAVKEWLLNHHLSFPIHIKAILEIDEITYSAILTSLHKNKKYTLTAPTIHEQGMWVTIQLESVQLTNTRAIVGTFHFYQDVMTLQSLAKETVYKEAPYGVFTLNKAGLIIDTNAMAFGLLNHTSPSNEGLHFLDFVSPKDRSKALSAFKKIITGFATELELTGLTKDLKQKQLYINGMPLAKNGEVYGIVGLLNDTTETYRVKERLRQSEVEYQSLFKENVDAVMTFDLQGHFTALNEATTNLSGYHREELLGRTFNFLIQPDLLERTLINFHATATGDSIEYETTIRTKQGASLTLNITLIPMIVDDHIYGINCIAKDLSEKNRLNQELRYFAYHDHLTGLRNQIALTRDIDALITDGTITSFGLLFIDLDRFKLINDTLGHTKGDELLKKIAKRMQTTKTGALQFYRYGGDEFIILYQNASITSIKHYASELIQLMSQSYVIDGIDIVNTPTIGISLYPDDALTVEQLVKKADQAMYHAKNNERGTIQFYQTNLPVQMDSILEVESALRKAIEQEEFILHYQPQIETKTGRIHGAEALIRWESPTRGLVPPNVFIPLAEETGLIIPIGEWVIEEVARTIRSMKKQGLELPISINLSIRQFYQRDLVERIEMILTRYDIDPSLITIEITESMAMDAAKALVILKELKALGVKLAIDDFGTGYSSLNYLKQFPIDYLKIDQSFIFDILDDRAITDSIILLGHRLNMSLVAEGVETKAHVELLREMNCDILQGYYFSKPISKEALIDFLTSFDQTEH